MDPQEQSFPDPDEFPPYDEVDSDAGQEELPADSFELNTADFYTEACGVHS